MTSAPDTKELEFALKVCRALDERAAGLPAPAAERLAAARRLAVARKKPEPAHAPVFVPALAGAPAGMSAAGPRIKPLRRLALVWPILALLIGIAGIAYWENVQRAAELADIDAAMLNDDLPLNAYLDHGFNAYLSRAR
ncbi:DUF3619 family protein [Trinickia caryophylli]|uniref:DUF3619 domain-containing protein n=1 Tax=Trinickia caryophylli TaxID=28094 RepID=A0A1X7GVE1_TRICW|nr:DUF3619 family protein [Trinickia caryophylli]PMS09381.1 DUF3619 domain-containing protein [Trinickia caryophylli]TRX18088.1 DUF3619 family protein [Trinickia caryophylli]WQE11129.1 DUF3619 family protein [Trinickia caryophylli]SMF75122.1 Protein of unknown function [Trinickia caryophylli]GLU35288.1 membrane protein [Trinickia caryophylli]